MTGLIKTNVILILFAFLVISCEDEPLILPASVDFDIVLVDSIAPAKVIFVNKSDRLDSYLWDFGDNSLSSDLSPEHIFENAGSFVVRLRGSNQNEELVIEKTFTIIEPTRFVIVNNSPFKLYSLTTIYLPEEGKGNEVVQVLGKLDPMTETTPEVTTCKELYVYFTNETGVKLRVAFPFELKEHQLNKLEIDKYTLTLIEGK